MAGPLRLGVIGTGSVVREIYQHLYFASAYSPQIRVEAAADPDGEALASFCERWSIPPERRFASHERMIRELELDAVHCNTPDSLHEEPALRCLDAGLDVLLPKPLASEVGAAHRMIERACERGRLLAVDFHKREDPRLKEAAARYRAGRYGAFQHAVWHMLDRLLVADPNHEPRFFASPDYAERDTPISFLTVHLADCFLRLTGLRPVTVRASGWSQKLPSLSPRPVHGYDLCETEVRFENDGVARFVTGWHLPNTAPALSNHLAYTVCTDGMLDMMRTSGLEELTHHGLSDPAPEFLTFSEDGSVSGFGVDSPGRLLEAFRRHRDGALSDREKERLLTPMELGFWSTVIVEALAVSGRLGYERFVCEQSPYSILDRRAENELLWTCRRHGIGLTPFRPLGAGVLSGKYRVDQAGPEGSYFAGARAGETRMLNEAGIRAAEDLAPIAERHRVTPAELSLAWVMQQPGVTSAVLGARKREYVESALRAVDLELTDEDRAAIDAVVPPGGWVTNHYECDVLLPMRYDYHPAARETGRAGAFIPDHRAVPA